MQFLKGEDRDGSHRWLSVADKKTIEDMVPGSVIIIEETSLDDRDANADPEKRKAMAMELAGVEPNTLFVLDEPVPTDSPPSALGEMGNLLPGVKGNSVETEEGLIPLWGWDPHRTLTEGNIENGDWKPLLHDPNNKGYVFVVNVEENTYQAIPRRQVSDQTKDLFSQGMDFIKLKWKS
ncbi:MAG: hypothetical protein IPN90_07875 [Elusimicrobia bacterium]|nr:hypothetical protein [Elusimicrobiota bacterium]